MILRFNIVGSEPEEVDTLQKGCLEKCRSDISTESIVRFAKSTVGGTCIHIYIFRYVHHCGSFPLQDWPFSSIYSPLFDTPAQESIFISLATGYWNSALRETIHPSIQHTSQRCHFLTSGSHVSYLLFFYFA